MDEFAERSVAEIERRIRKIYSQAAAEIAEDMDKYLQKFRKKDAMLRAKVLKGEITEDEYKRWKQGQVFAGDQWLSRQRQATGTLLFANQKANAIVEGKRLEVFADGANYQAYEFERDTGIGIAFDLLNEQAVERLIRDEPELLPRRKVDRDKDRGWNQTNIANAVTQSILQGESMEEAAKRIGRDTGITNEKAMMRYARTAVNGAENAGALQGLREIQAMGVEVQKQWVSTLDSKTRDAHQELDGQVADLDEPFDSPLGPIDHPGDPSAAAGNVYNCRCTIKAYYPQYADMISGERRRRAYNDDDSRESTLVGDMTYKEWKAAKGKTRTYAEWDPAAARKTVEHPVQSKPRTSLFGPAVDGIDEAHRASVQEMLQKSPSIIQEAWQKYASQMYPPEFDADPDIGDAYYSHSNRRTHFASMDVAFGEYGAEPENSVFFHESGHNLDHLAGTGNKTLSETYNDGEFVKTLHKEIEDNLRRHYLKEHPRANLWWEKDRDDFDFLVESGKHGGMSIEENVRYHFQTMRVNHSRAEYIALRDELNACEGDPAKLRAFWDRRIKDDPEVQKQMRGTRFGITNECKAKTYASKDSVASFAKETNTKYTGRQRADIGDMYDGYLSPNFGIHRPLGWGHKPGYFKGTGAEAAHEAFAEMFSATVSNKESLEVIKEQFPEAYKVFLKMIGGIAHG